MSSELGLLLITAIAIACLHTAAGPDHYVPFIALAKSRRWSFPRTLFWVTVCGCGHVWSSVLLGLGGALVGWSLARIEWLESVRGGIAGWALLAFGMFYLVFALVRARQGRSHSHFGSAGGGAAAAQGHEQAGAQERHRVSPWVLFLIFLLGPCEPMIPLLAFPAAKSSWWTLLLLIAVYTVCTLVTMIGLVLLGCYGLSRARPGRLERHLPALGGLAILICGAGMVFLGW